MTANETTTRPPWVFGARDTRHRGVEVDTGGTLLTVTQAIKQGGLDWEVDLRNPRSDDEDAIPAEGWKQVVKTEDVVENGQLVKAYRTLGMVRGRYTVVQNRAAFKFFDNATMDGAAIIKAVGHLDFGRVVWAMAQRPQTMELYPGDVVHETLVLITAHDGSHTLKVMFTPYLSSTGTMLGFRRGRKMQSEVCLRHTRSINDRLDTVHNILAAESGYFDRWRAALVGTEDQQGFKQKLVTDDEVRRVVSALFPAQKKLDEDGNKYEKVSAKAQKARDLILSRIEEQHERAKRAYADAGQDAPNGVTQLDVFLGVSEYVAKDKSVKNEGNSWVASTFGSGADMRQKAFEIIGSL